MAAESRLNRLLSGVRLLGLDAGDLRLVERYVDGSGRRRVRPSTGPLRALLRELRTQYLESAKDIDPTLTFPISRLRLRPGHSPAEIRDADVPGFAEWRAQLNDARWTPTARGHVLRLGVALNALDHLERELSELDDRQRGGTDLDDYSPEEVLDVIETLLAALAPVTLNPVLLAQGLRYSADRIKHRQRRGRKYDVAREREWMVKALGSGPFTGARAWKLAGEIVTREGLAPADDSSARRRAQQRLVNRVDHLLRRSPKSKPRLS